MTESHDPWDDPKILLAFILMVGFLGAVFIYGIFYWEPEPEPTPSPVPPGDPEPEDEDPLETLTEPLPPIGGWGRGG